MTRWWLYLPAPGSRVSSRNRHNGYVAYGLDGSEGGYDPTPS